MVRAPSAGSRSRTNIVHAARSTSELPIAEPANAIRRIRDRVIASFIDYPQYTKRVLEGGPEKKDRDGVWTSPNMGNYPRVANRWLENCAGFRKRLSSL